MELDKKDFNLIQEALDHYYWHLHEIEATERVSEIVITEAKINRMYRKHWEANHA